MLFYFVLLDEDLRKILFFDIWRDTGMWRKGNISGMCIAKKIRIENKCCSIFLKYYFSCYIFLYYIFAIYCYIANMRDDNIENIEK